MPISSITPIQPAKTTVVDPRTPRIILSDGASADGTAGTSADIAASQLNRVQRNLADTLDQVLSFLNSAFAPAPVVKQQASTVDPTRPLNATMQTATPQPQNIVTRGTFTTQAISAQGITSTSLTSTGAINGASVTSSTSLTGATLAVTTPPPVPLEGVFCAATSLAANANTVLPYGASTGPWQMQPIGKAISIAAIQANCISGAISAGTVKFQPRISGGAASGTGVTLASGTNTGIESYAPGAVVLPAAGYLWINYVTSSTFSGGTGNYITVRVWVYPS